jgi:hypothetical protein
MALPFQSPKLKRPVTSQQKILNLHTFNNFAIPTAAKQAEKPNPAYYNASRKSSGGGGIWASRQQKVGTPDVAHHSSVPCRHPSRHVFPRITSKPPSATDQPIRHRKQIQKPHENQPFCQGA